jgi:two-component system NtrC family sensor kinase
MADGSTHAHRITQTTTWRARNALDDLLSDASELEAACQAALKFILQVIGRSGGALILWQPNQDDPPLLIKQALPEAWEAQDNQPSDRLRQAAALLAQRAEALLPQSFPELKDLSIGLPLSSEAGLRGALLIAGETCSEEEIELLYWLIPSIARAATTLQARQTQQSRTRELAHLQAELTRTGFGADSEAMQAQLIRETCKIMQVETCALTLLDELHEGWMISKSLGDQGQWVYQVNSRDGPGLVKECLRNGAMACSNDVKHDPRFDAASDGMADLTVRNFLCAPILANGQVLGAIKTLNKQNGDFDAYDQDLLTMIAVQAANALYGTRLIQQLKVTNADLEASRWELLGSRNTLRALFDHLPAALYIIDADYKLLAINKSRTQRIGQPPQALVGQLCYRALFNRSDPCPECRVRETLQTGQSTQRSERRYVGDDVFEWEISSHPILDENEQVIQAILLELDNTERRRLEAILTQSEKLAAIGQLAAGVAHEINNPLTAIIANAQILHRELPANSDLQESVDLIARAGARATQVVRNLLDFARKEEVHLGLTNVNETLERALELVQHEILARGVRLDFSPDPNLPPILASQDHLQSVWLNLLLNAIDSLDKSPGEIKIITRKLSGDIYISVTDNGKGIPADRLTRIFEPFYTTKAPGRGTGLGLSVSHRIVKQHGGRISVESTVGVGSTFTVVLPAS